MKVIAKSIEMVAWFENQGNVNPIRFRMECEDKSYKVIKIDKVIKKAKEKIAGNPMQIFTCSSVIEGEEKIFELKYEISSCKWMLFKI